MRAQLRGKLQGRYADLSDKFGARRFATAVEGAVAGLIAPVMDVDGKILPGDSTACTGFGIEDIGLSLVSFDSPAASVVVSHSDIALNAQNEGAGCRRGRLVQGARFLGGRSRGSLGDIRRALRGFVVAGDFIQGQ
jgi:hypothetical protein